MVVSVVVVVVVVLEEDVEFDVCHFMGLILYSEDCVESALSEGIFVEVGGSLCEG
jgi:hypothetical protein